MSQVSPKKQIKFGPINVYGNPVDRPADTGSLVRDFRVMPGHWLRLRSGRLGRRNLTNAYDVLDFIPVEFAGQLGSGTHLMHVTYGASDSRIIKMNISGGTITFPDSEAGIETLCHQYSNLATYKVPWAKLPDSIVFGNGWGYHGSNLEPIPFLTQYDSAGNVRYFGLHSRPDSPRYAVGGPPSFSYAAGGGSPHNQVTTSVTLYVGLYNAVTGHYSNPLPYPTTITTTGGTGIITANSLRAANYTTHGSTETAELYYVFYATIDGYQVPYLIQSATLDGPYKVAVGTASTTLNIMGSTANGWTLDLTKRAPTKNYPPRQMSAIWNANGRLYGIPYEFYDQTGTNDYFQFGFGFSANDPFQLTKKDQGSVCWSEAEGSSRTQDFTGDPLQSWPPNNISPVPSGERPIFGTPAPNEVDSLVWTPTRTYLLKEQSDGLHEWECVSDAHGLYGGALGNGVRTVKKTRHGVCWMSQRKQVMIFKG